VTFQATYEYNVADQLEKVTGSDGAVTDPAYDRLGRKVSLTDADMGTWQYRYDAAGNLVKQRDARNQAICFTYDGHNRLLGKTYHAGVSNLDTLTCSGAYTVSYGYDAGANGLGRRTSLADLSGATSWSYDARGRVTSATKTIGSNTFVTGHSYRSDDLAATLTYPDGEVLTYGHDAAGRLTTLSGAPESWGGAATANYLTAATYTALGQPLSRVYSNTHTLTYGYHPTNYRLTALTAPGVNLGYGYDANGNVQTITDTNQATTFTYDDLDRLKTASGGYSASYGYQPNGNLTTKTEGGVTVNLNYGAGNQPRPHAPVSVNGQAYTYTANGNLEARPGQNLTYDAENRLTQVVSGTITTTFTYDGDGNLVKKVTSAGATLYVGAHYEVQPLPASPPPIPPPPLPLTLTKRSFLPFVANTALFVDGQPAQPVKYYLVGGQRIASRTGSAGPVTYYYHDQLGSTVGSSGGEQTRYWPYGATRSGSLGTAYQFTGQRREAALGLYFYQARWYDAVIGRFLSPDTIVPAPGDPQSLNRYAYVLNNPLRYTDPTGHAWALPDNDGITTPVGILDPNRVRSEDERRLLFAWFDANPGYNPATDPVLNGETSAQPLDLNIASSLLAMEYGFWQLDRGDRSGLDTVGAGLLGAAVVLGPGAGSGMPGQNQGPVTIQKPRGGTYLLKDPATGEVMRTGRTSDLARRQAEHARNSDTSSLRFELDIKVDDYAVQRGREQMLHDQYPPPLNKIRPISPRNPQLQSYLDAVRRFLGLLP
jgi:RHS repeat-associated protein